MLPVINIWASPNLSPLQVSCLKFWRFFCSKTSHPREVSLSVAQFPLTLAWLSQTMQCKFWVVWRILAVGLWVSDPPALAFNTKQLSNWFLECSCVYLACRRKTPNNSESTVKTFFVSQIMPHDSKSMQDFHSPNLLIILSETRFGKMHPAIEKSLFEDLENWMFGMRLQGLEFGFTKIFTWQLFKMKNVFINLQLMDLLIAGTQTQCWEVPFEVSQQSTVQSLLGDPFATPGLNWLIRHH